MIGKSFPIFKLTHKGWKLDYLCATDYPGWIRNNIDENGTWLVTSGHKAVKNEEDSQEIVFTGSGKWKVKQSAPDAERARKKIKGESVLCLFQCANNVYIRS